MLQRAAAGIGRAIIGRVVGTLYALAGLAALAIMLEAARAIGIPPGGRSVLIVLYFGGLVWLVVRRARQERQLARRLRERAGLPP
ncbi:MAG TPA: hypothetical protein VL328_12585 [Gemmatimonadaceae bacterium]|jgi:hypothetical protein|nr:hypothetical protein [Gemmatimonadaceae bacterium]